MVFSARLILCFELQISSFITLKCSLIQQLKCHYTIHVSFPTDLTCIFIFCPLSVLFLFSIYVSVSRSSYRLNSQSLAEILRSDKHVIPPLSSDRVLTFLVTFSFLHSIFAAYLLGEQNIYFLKYFLRNF